MDKWIKFSSWKLLPSTKRSRATRKLTTRSYLGSSFGSRSNMGQLTCYAPINAFFLREPFTLSRTVHNSTIQMITAPTSRPDSHPFVFPTLRFLSYETPKELSMISSLSLFFWHVPTTKMKSTSCWIAASNSQRSPSFSTQMWHLHLHNFYSQPPITK